MKKLKVILALSCVFATCLHAQEAKTCFVNMPDSLSPILTSVNRADCIDFLASKMKAIVTNRFGGKSEMTQLSSDYINVKMTPESTWQMKLLPLNDSTKVICTISTVCGPACDSHFHFYTTKWKELPSSSFLQIPVLADFLSIPDTVKDYAVQDAEQRADMLLMKADFSATNDKLTFTFTTPRYMENTSSDKLKAYIRSQKVYTWKQGRFLAE